MCKLHRQRSNILYGQNFSYLYIASKIQYRAPLSYFRSVFNRVCPDNSIAAYRLFNFKIRRVSNNISTFQHFTVSY